MNRSEEFVLEKFKENDYKAEGEFYFYETPDILKVLPIQEWAKSLPLTYCVQAFDISIFYDPTAKFDYYTCSASTHDGTLLFEYNTIANCFSKIFRGSYYTPKGCPKDSKKAKIDYTIGDFVIEDIFHEHGKNNPWPETTTIVYLPIRYNWFYY